MPNTRRDFRRQQSLNECARQKLTTHQRTDKGGAMALVYSA
jgi:hypothetical protein